MKKIWKTFLAMFLLGGVLTTSISCGVAPSGDDPALPTENEVLEVYLVYNGKKVSSGLIAADVLQGTITVSSDVKVVGNPTYTVNYETDNSSIAEITNRGVITLKKAGETIVTVSAGGKRHQVVLVVEDNYSTSTTMYNIYVEGGFANVSQSKPGGHVQLKVDIPLLESEHKEFTGWQYLKDETNEVIQDLWINGSVFRMPNYDIRIKAIKEDKLYSFNLADATIKTCSTDDGEFVPEYDVEDNVRIYGLPYNANVTVKANPEPAGKMFVGFDVGAKNNRKGELGVDEYTFNMPGETYSIFAMFGTTRKIPFTSASAMGKTGVAITGGVLKDETAADPDLNGYNGYRFSFASNRSATEAGEYPSGTLTGCGDFSTLKHGSQTVRMICKNPSDQAFAVEMFAEQYSTIAGSGSVEIPANSLVTKNFIIQMGFHNPNFGLILRDECHGGSDSTINFDVVFVAADTYPSGDPMFAVPEAQYVTLKSLTTGADFPAGSGIRPDCFQCGPSAASTAGNPTSGSFGGRKNTNNSNGITHMVLRDNYITYSTDPSSYPFIYAEANNQPDFNEEETVTVYFRVTNTSNNTGVFIFSVGNNTNVLSDSAKVSASITFEAKQTYVFGITYVRKNINDKLIIGLTRPAKGQSADFNIIVQMMYNNKIGCVDENIYTANNA